MASEPDKMTNVIAVIGRSNSGKTTLIESLVKYFKKRDLSISVIKHTHHNFEIDHIGKDSYRFKDAGADSVIITGSRKLAVVSDLKEPLSPLEISKKYLDNKCALIIIEGFKDFDIPSIEVIGDSGEPPLYENGFKKIIALVSDLDIETDFTLFRRGEVDKIAEFILKKFEIK